MLLITGFFTGPPPSSRSRFLFLFGYSLISVRDERKLQELPISGVGQPTIVGICTVLNRIRQEHDQKLPQPHILWINLREECVIYINGHPYVLREAEKPMKNIGSQNAGIRLSQLEV